MDEERWLSEWIRRYTPRLLPVARAFAHGPDEAEDILQEVWIRASQRAEQLGDHPDVGAWLFTVTLNEGRSRLRRRQRRALLNGLRGAGEAGTEPAEVSIPRELARLQLWRAVAALPALQREVLLLRVVSDFTTAQTAASLNRAEGTVKASLFRALRTLRTSLDDGVFIALGKSMAGSDEGS